MSTVGPSSQHGTRRGKSEGWLPVFIADMDEKVSKGVRDLQLEGMKQLSEDEKLGAFYEYAAQHFPNHPERQRKNPDSVAFGRIKFKRHDTGDPSYYCRVPCPDKPASDDPNYVDKLYEYTQALDTIAAHVYHMFEHFWDMTPPSLLLSVTGGAQQFDLSSRLTNVFSHGIVNAALTSNAWIIDGGTDAGVMKYVGDAVRMLDTHNKVPTIGIATWGIVTHRNLLERPKNAKIDKTAVKYSKSLENNFTQAALDTNHSHFILVDNGSDDQFGKEMDLRAKIEQKISRQRSNVLRRYATKAKTETEFDDLIPEINTPSVCLVLQGGPGTVDTVVGATKENIPIITIEGSGNCADILAFAWHHLHTKPAADDSTPVAQCAALREFFAANVERDWKKYVDVVKKSVSEDGGELDDKEKATLEEYEKFTEKEVELMEKYKNFTEESKKLREQIQSLGERIRDNLTDIQNSSHRAKARHGIHSPRDAVRQRREQLHRDRLQINAINRQLIELFQSRDAEHRARLFLLFKKTFPKLECCPALRKFIEGINPKHPILNKIEQIVTVVFDKDRVSTYRLREETTEPLDRYIFQAYLKGSRITLFEQLLLAIHWNRIDLARDQILSKMNSAGGPDQDISNYEITIALHMALREDVEPSLVGLLLDWSSIGDIDLEQLYNSVRLPDALRKRVHRHHKKEWRLENPNSDRPPPPLSINYEILDFLMRKLLGKKQYVHRYEDDGTLTQNLDLLIWAVLSNRMTMAKFLWTRSSRPILSALLMARLVHGLLSRNWVSPEDRPLMAVHKNEFEELAVGVLQVCHNNDDNSTQGVVASDLRRFEHGYTIVDLAYDAQCGNFMCERAVQNAMTHRWSGYLDPAVRTPFIMLAMVLPFLVLIEKLIPFDEDFAKPMEVENSIVYVQDLTDFENNVAFEPPTTADTHDDDNDGAGAPTQQPANASPTGLARQGSQMARLRQTNSDRPNTVTVEYMNGVKEEGVDLKRVASTRMHQCGGTLAEPSAASRWAYYRAKIFFFYHAPVTKFWMRMVAYAAFLCLFTYVSVEPFTDHFTFAEAFLAFWIFSMVMDEISQVFEDGIRAWAKSSWNQLDLLMLLMYFVALILRFIDHDSSKAVFGIASLAFYARLLNVFSVNKYLGPLLVMVQKMSMDIVLFLGLMLVALVSFGVAFQTILFPDGENLGQSALLTMFYRPYFMIFGEFFLDEMNTEALNCEDPSACGRPQILSVLFLALYLIVAVVLLLNLLIAMMSDTYTKVRDNSEQVWRFQRFDLIKEYDNAYLFPPPLVIVSILWDILRSHFCASRRDTKVKSRQMMREKLNGIINRFVQQQRLEYLRQKKQQFDLSVPEKLRATGVTLEEMSLTLQEDRDVSTKEFQRVMSRLDKWREMQARQANEMSTLRRDVDALLRESRELSVHYRSDRSLSTPESDTPATPPGATTPSVIPLFRESLPSVQARSASSSRDRTPQHTPRR